MPLLGGEVICKDWEPAEHHRKTPYDYSEFPKPREQGMVSGYLYYYSYTSSVPVEQLDSFEKLRHFIFYLSIHDDHELGWVGYIRDDRKKYFPPSDNNVTIQLDGETHEFSIKDVHRGNEIGETPPGDKRLIVSSAPDLLYRWLDRKLNMGNLISSRKNHPHSSALMAIGTFVFVEIIEKYGIYSLRPNYHHYKEYQRQTNE